MMWTAIGCLIGGLILLIWMLIWNSTSQKDPASRASYTRWQGLKIGRASCRERVSFGV